MSDTGYQGRQETYQVTFGANALRNRRERRRFENTLAYALEGYGCRISYGRGVWDGETEDSVTVTFQGPSERFRAMVTAAAFFLQDERLAHVEKLYPEVSYLDLAEVRNVRA